MRYRSKKSAGCMSLAMQGDGGVVCAGSGKPYAGRLFGRRLLDSAPTLRGQKPFWGGGREILSA